MSSTPMEVTESLEKNVRAVLMSFPKGVLLAKFCGHYRGTAKETFPWRALGYRCAMDLLRAMPTAVKLQYSEKDKDHRVYPIAKTGVYLPSWQQKFKDKRLPSVLAPPPNFGRWRGGDPGGTIDWEGERKMVGGGTVEWEGERKMVAGFVSNYCQRDSENGGSSESDSDGSWHEELLTSSPFSSGIKPQATNSIPPLQQEWDPPTLRLSPRSIPNGNGLIPVHVSKVESPSLVWVQLTSDPGADVVRLSEVMADLKPLRLTQVGEGSVCCVNLVAGDYRRVKVVQFDNYVARQQVAVLQVDTGSSQTVPCSQLHTLPPSLSLPAVPPLAMPCRLAGISSTFGGDKWYFYDNQLLWRLIMKKKMYVRKVSQPHHSPRTSPGDAKVVVEMFLDPRGERSVATLLFSSGMHVKFSGVGEHERKERQSSSFPVVNHFQTLSRPAIASPCDLDQSFSSLHVVPASSSPLLISSPHNETPPPAILQSPYLRLQHFLSTFQPNTTT